MSKGTTFLLLAGIALVVVALAALAALSQRNMGAQVTEKIVYFDITPRDRLTLKPGESITFTAEGNFGTVTMPIDVDWSLEQGASLGLLKNCRYTKTCTFSAGSLGGTVTIRADANRGALTDKVQLTIVEKPANPFSDALPDWAADPIIELKMAGIIKGYDDGTYGPGDPVTNGQVITLLMRVLKQLELASDPVGCTQEYSDVPENHFAFFPACLFKWNGWSTQGSTFKPDEPATRGETARFVHKSVGENLLSKLNAQPSTQKVFNDIPLSSPYFKDTAVMNATGIMTGRPTGDFGVHDNLNRAEVGVVIFRILEKLK